MSVPRASALAVSKVTPAVTAAALGGQGGLFWGRRLLCEARERVSPAPKQLLDGDCPMRTPSRGSRAHFRVRDSVTTFPGELAGPWGAFVGRAHGLWLYQTVRPVAGKAAGTRRVCACGELAHHPVPAAPQVTPSCPGLDGPPSLPPRLGHPHTPAAAAATGHLCLQPLPSAL